MPTYSFQMSAGLAGSSVSVTAVGSSTVVASGTLDTNALFAASLPVGDYVAKAADGHYSYQSSGTVVQPDSDRLADLDSAIAHKTAGVVVARSNPTPDVVMATPPTVGALATATAIASPKKWPSVTNSGSQTVVNRSLFGYRGAGNVQVFGTNYPDYNYVVANSLTDPVGSNHMSYCADFFFDGTTIELMFKGSACKLRVRVDGQLVDSAPVVTAANGSTYYLPLTFATRKARRISVEGNASFTWGGVTTGPTDSIWKASVPTPRCIIVGDSFTDGTGAAGGGATSWVRRFGERMGWADTWASGVGGTGYLNAGTGGRTTFRGRVAADVIAQAPDVVVIAGGINDSATDPALVNAEADALFSQIKAGLPGVTLVVLSPFWRNGVSTYPTSLLAVRDAIKQAAADAGAIYIDVLEGPLDAVTTTTLSAGAAAAATSISTAAVVPVQATIELGAGANYERRVVTNVSGVGPFTLTVNKGLQSAHASGETIRTVGSSFWTGTGKVGSLQGDGNSDLYVDTDGTHPSQAGHDALGLYVADRLITALAGSA